jgi:hypothetical protein
MDAVPHPVSRTYTMATQLFKRILLSEKLHTGKPGLEFQYLEPQLSLI